MTTEEIEALLAKTGAIQDGHFLLTSGRHSPRYVEKFRLLENPALTVPLCGAIAERFRPRAPEVVLGAVTGGVLLSFEIARQLGIRSIFAEREVGKLVLRRGFALRAGERVLIVDDILTTGGSVKELLEVARAANAPVAGVAVLVDRRSDRNDGLELFSLAQLTIPNWEAASCPLCREGVPLVKPGSRKIVAA